MKKLLSIFASLTAVFLGSFLLAQAATVFYGNQVGNSATSGYVLQSTGPNSTSNWVATSTLGISSSGNSGTISTSSPLVSGQSVYATGVNTIASAANLLWNNATSLLTVTGNVSTTQISSTGSAYFATSGGNVGIGTTSPSALLSLGNGSGAAGTTAALGINFGDPTANLYRAGTGYLQTDASKFYGAGTLNFGTLGTGSLRFDVNGTSKIYIGSDSSTRIASDMALSWNTATNITGGNDIGISRGAIGKLYVGNGTQGDYTGTLIAGNVGIGTTSPGTLLSLGNTGANTINISATATSTFGSGINLTTGCFAIGGVCVGGGSGTVTSVAETVPSFLSISGSPITTSGTLAITLSGTALPLLNGGTGLTAVGASSTVMTTNGTVMQWNKLATSQLTNDSGFSALSLAAGTYTNGDMCTYASSGTLLNCNTAVPTGTVTSVGLSSSGSITIGSSPITTSGTLTADLNLANANSFTGLQSFANASSTQFSAGTNTFYVDSTGHITAKDTVSGYSGVLSPLRNPSFMYATTTVYTATSSTNAMQSVAPYAGTLHDVRCHTDAGTLNVDIAIGSTHLALLNASTTVGTFSFTSNNTFTAGQVFTVVAGTPASSPTVIACTGDVTITP